MYVENLRAALKLSTTPVGHNEVDLLGWTSEAAVVDSLDKIFVKVLI